MLLVVKEQYASRKYYMLQIPVRKVTQLQLVSKVSRYSRHNFASTLVSSIILCPKHVFEVFRVTFYENIVFNELK